MTAWTANGKHSPYLYDNGNGPYPRSKTSHSDNYFVLYYKSISMKRAYTEMEKGSLSLPCVAKYGLKHGKGR